MTTKKTYSLTGMSDFLDSLGHSDAVMGVCREAAQTVIVNAGVQAAKHGGLGHYTDSLTIEELPRRGRRVIGVVSHDPAGMVLESRYGILARAIKAAKSKT